MKPKDDDGDGDDDVELNLGQRKISRKVAEYEAENTFITHWNRALKLPRNCLEITRQSFLTLFVTFYLTSVYRLCAQCLSAS